MLPLSITHPFASACVIAMLSQTNPVYLLSMLTLTRKAHFIHALLLSFKVACSYTAGMSDIRTGAQNWPGKDSTGRLWKMYRKAWILNF